MKTVTSDNTTMCAACDIDLASCDTVWAAEGTLYCSRECGIHDFKVAYDKDAERHFDEVAEEVSTIDIGLKEATDKCDQCGSTFKVSDLHASDCGLLCDKCIKSLTHSGNRVIIFDSLR